jgi:hypothetical protein
MFVMSIVSVAFYGGMTSSFSQIKSSREDVRATQIMMQKLEAIRLCTWSELTNFSFKEPYDPLATHGASSMYYFGTVSKGPATAIPGNVSYQNNMSLVTVGLVWTNSGQGAPIVRNRQMQTHVARYGLQSYIWGAIQ